MQCQVCLIAACHVVSLACSVYADATVSFAHKTQLSAAAVQGLPHAAAPLLLLAPAGVSAATAATSTGLSQALSANSLLGMTGQAVQVVQRLHALQMFAVMLAESHLQLQLQSVRQKQLHVLHNLRLQAKTCSAQHVR